MTAYPYEPCPCGEMHQHCAATKCDRLALVANGKGRYPVERLSSLSTARLRALLSSLAKGDRVTSIATGNATVVGFGENRWPLLRSDETGLRRAVDPNTVFKLIAREGGDDG